MRITDVGFFMLAAATLACGVAAPGPSSPTTPASSAGASSPPAGSEGGWRKGMSKDEQIAFMKAKVVPRMAKVFQGHGEPLGCKTCHGPAYKSPKDFLPKLVMRNGAITAFAEEPETAKFMAEQVVPEMAAAMGMKPYDPATREGFGCGGCHAIDVK